MRVRTLPLAVILLLLLFAIPHPVRAQNEMSLAGVIVGINQAQNSFLVQELAPFAAGRVWTVRVTAATEARRDDDQVARGTQTTLRLLRVGDPVEVQGWLIGGAQVVARTVTVRGFGGTEPGRLGQEMRISGVIVDLVESGEGILQVQTQGFGQASTVWTVNLQTQTRVEDQVRDRDWEGGKGRGRRALRLMRVGDFVQVDGRLTGTRQVQAREIKVQVHAGFPSGSSPVPFPVQTVIIAPGPGEELTEDEFSVVGQTVPGAQVRVDVTARIALLNMPVASGTVTANQSGFFAFRVRPQIRVPGTVYTITVTSTYQGITAPPVTVTAQQS